MHWTYVKGFYKRKLDLEQGDIIQLKPLLRKLLKEKHPEVNCEGCYGFLVVTQSCDLVRRRRGKCRSTHINLAPIRSLRGVLLDFLNEKCNAVYHRKIFPVSEMKKAQLSLETLFNQNEFYTGLFYLHPEEKYGIGEESVALLRQMTTIDIGVYKLLTKCREGRLTTEFGHKLGWLVGYMFSRIGTKEDWSSESRKTKLQRRISTLLEEATESSPNWISDSSLASAQQASFNPKESELFEASEIMEALESFEDKAPSELILDAVESALRKSKRFPGLTNADINVVRNAMSSDPKFKRVKRIINIYKNGVT